MDKKYEYYQITCTRDYVENDEAKTDFITFRVRGTSHLQYIASNTKILGLAKSAQYKINQYISDGYRVTTIVGGHTVSVSTC